MIDFFVWVFSDFLRKIINIVSKKKFSLYCKRKFKIYFILGFFREFFNKVYKFY